MHKSETIVHVYSVAQSSTEITVLSFAYDPTLQGVELKVKTNVKNRNVSIVCQCSIVIIQQETLQ